MRKASLLLTVVQNHFGKLGERINISRHIKPLAHKCIVYIRRTKLNDAKDSNQLKKYIERELSLENKQKSVEQEQQPSTAFLLLKAFSFIRSKLCYRTSKQNH
jgi:hypothetical protein